MSDEEELVELLRRPIQNKKTGKYWYAGTFSNPNQAPAICPCQRKVRNGGVLTMDDRSIPFFFLEPTEIILKGLRHSLLIGECERCGMVAVGEYPPDWTEAPF